MNPAVLVFVLLAATVLAILGIFYLRFRAAPARVWKGRLVSARTALDEKLRAARRTLADADAEPPGLRQEYLNQLHRGLPIEKLIGYPGIGPGTVSKLREANFTSIEDAFRFPLVGIAGIGPTRAGDILKALQQIREDTVRRFDAGACPEATAFAQDLARRKAEAARRRAEAEADVRTAEADLQRLSARSLLADDVTFLSHVFRRPVPGLTDAVMAEPFDEPARPRELPVALPAPAPMVRPRPAPPPPPPATPADRLRAAAAFGFAIAKADGRVAAAERKQIRAFLERRYAPEPALAVGLDSLLKAVERGLPTLGESLATVRQTIPATDWPELYQFAGSVVDAAGVRNTREIECLARVAEALGLDVKPTAPPPPPAPLPMSTPTTAPPSDDDARAVLEIAPGVPLSADLVRRQYYLLTDRFDPAKFAGHGAEFSHMAAEKRARVAQAARHLLAAYNQPLDVPAPARPADPRHNPDLDAVFGA